MLLIWVGRDRTPYIEFLFWGSRGVSEHEGCFFLLPESSCRRLSGFTCRGSSFPEAPVKVNPNLPTMSPLGGIADGKEYPTGIWIWGFGGDRSVHKQINLREFHFDPQQILVESLRKPCGCSPGLEKCCRHRGLPTLGQRRTC